MKKTNLLTALLLTLSFASPTFAQDLVPATSEDIEMFDKQLEKQNAEKERQKKDNFGQQVQAEAKKAREKGEDFGKWVSGQRRRNDENRPDASGSRGSGKDSAKESGAGEISKGSGKDREKHKEREKDKGKKN